jgi:hypothetical protein
LGQRLSSFYPAQYLCGLARSVRQRTQASRLGARLYVMPASGSGGIVRGCAPVCLHRVCGGMACHGIMATCKKKNGERSRGRAAERHPRTRVFIADDRTTANVRRDLACARARRSWGGDFQSALQMLLALAARAGRASQESLHPRCPHRPAEALHLRRQTVTVGPRSAFCWCCSKSVTASRCDAPEVRQDCVQA